MVSPGEVLRIGSDGNQEFAPNYVAALAQRTTNMAGVASGALQTVTWESAPIDTHSFWPGLGGDAKRLQIPVGYAGKYRVSIIARMSGTTSPNQGTYRRLDLFKNAATQLNELYFAFDGVSLVSHFTYETVLELAEGDYLWIKQAHNASLDLATAGGTRMLIEKVD